MVVAMPVRINPDVAVSIMLAKGYRPRGPYPGAMVPWESDCVALGHRVSPRLANVKANRSHCKPCSDERASLARAVPREEAERDLARLRLAPLEDYPGTAQRPWLCLCLVCFSEVPVLLKSLRARDSGCRECGNARKGAHKLVPADMARDRMREAGLIPVEDYPGRIDAPWRCRCEVCDRVDTHLLHYVVNANRRRPGRGCGDCRSEDFSLARRREKHSAAVRVMTAANLTPLGLFPGRNVPWPCRCGTCGDRVSPRLGAILAGQGGCVPCGKARGAAKRRIPEHRARAHMLRRGLYPVVPYPGFGVAWPSTCGTCRKTVSPTLADVLDGHGCLVCNGHRVAPEAAVELFLRRGFIPQGPFPGVKKPWTSLHECGNVVHPTLTRVRRGTSGTAACTVCTPGGWNSDAPSLVYVIIHPEWDAGKVGVMNRGSRRLDVFRGQGWLVVGTRVVDTGREALRIEKSTLDRIMGIGPDRIPPYLGREELPSGWQETFCVAHTTGEEALAIVRSVDRYSRLTMPNGDDPHEVGHDHHEHGACQGG